MRSPLLRSLAVAAAPLLLVVSACSPDGSGDETAATSGDDAAVTSAGPAASLADVAVENDGDTPTLTWNGAAFTDGDLPFTTYETQTEQVSAGDGDAVEATDEVDVRYLAVNGTNGEQIASTFEGDEAVTMDLNNETLIPAFKEGLPGKQVGEALLMALPASEAFGPAGNSQIGVGPEDTLVFYLEVDDTNPPLTKAEGTEVEPQDGLPTVQADGESAASIDVEGAEPPERLVVVQPLIEGERKVVAAGQVLRVHYTGVKLSDGEQFDTSYESGEPFEFQVGAGNVIPGWDEGLVGQTVGSRVLLVIPAAQAYGEKQPVADDAAATATAPPPHPLEGEDLVFVVDILGAY